MERLIRLRHNPNKFEDLLHHIASRNPKQELKTRTGEYISKFAALRDKALSHYWKNESDNERVNQIKNRVEELLDRANKGD